MSVISNIFKKENIKEEMKKHNNTLTMMDCYVCRVCETPCYTIISRSSEFTDPTEFKDGIKRYVDVLNGKSKLDKKLPKHCIINDDSAADWVIIDYDISMQKIKEFYGKTNVTKNGLKQDEKSKDTTRKTSSRFKDIDLL